ncbi:MAG: hypothetical protein Q8L79_04285 [Methylobacter sp.]|uniref:hypothetical protein n=1 Tax=Methylobacter sp. TaxID=2051955 RepID=UPI0027306147|nr:hypothetical protein [Methylobacter sp.]MDP1664324.1 hypothetical protein [Methylobacter sp.]MDP1970490.1 hypothetical protein [Methylobacter sp.]
MDISGLTVIKIAGTTGLITLFKAFAAQALGLALTTTLAWMSPALFHGAWRLALVQGAMAALWSGALRQPYWWFPIHLLFLPAAIAMFTLQLPSWLYLLTVLLLALVFWGTVKGDVPLFLSSNAVADAVAAIVERENAGVFADLGAGIGSVAVPLAQHLPITVDAWERAPLPWLITAWRCRKLPNVNAKRASLWDCNLARYGVVFAFLSPAVMVELGEKVRREMRPGSLFISSSFPIPDWEPEKIVDIADRRRTKLFCYRLCRPE